MEAGLHRYYIQGVKLQLEGRHVAPGFAPPPDVVGRLLSLEVWLPIYPAHFYPQGQPANRSSHRRRTLGTCAR